MARTIEEAEARIAELEQRAAAAQDDKRSVRRRARLTVAARAQRHIAEMQAHPRPSEWTDGAVVALERFHAELEQLLPDDEPEG